MSDSPTPNRSNALATLELDVCFLDTTADIIDVLALYERVCAAKQQATAIKAQMDDRMIAWMQVHGGFNYNETEFYVGKAKTVKPKSIAEVVHAALESGGPDALIQVLGSDPFKKSVAKAQLGEERCKELFETKIKDKLEMKAVKTRFLPQKEESHANQ